ncbi:MAG: hypothetical protein M0P69_12730 [Bacteroidales bacterium]|nr:hypothetical protein [Bacteroidales bacterium]
MTNLILAGYAILITLVIIIQLIRSFNQAKKQERERIRAIIQAEENVEKIENLLKIYEKQGFKDKEQMAIDIVKITNRRA